MNSLQEKDRFPCISVRQPWAWLIIRGFCDVINRHDFAYPGFIEPLRPARIIIHASKKFDPDFYGKLRITAPQIFRGMPREEEFRRQMLIGSVSIDEIVPIGAKRCWLTQSPWDDEVSKWKWHARNPRRFEQEISLLGNKSIFWPPRAILERYGLTSKGEKNG